MVRRRNSQIKHLSNKQECFLHLSEVIVYDEPAAGMKTRLAITKRSRVSISFHCILLGGAL